MLTIGLPITNLAMPPPSQACRAPWTQHVYSSQHIGIPWTPGLRTHILGELTLIQIPTACLSRSTHALPTATEPMDVITSLIFHHNPIMNPTFQRHALDAQP